VGIAADETPVLRRLIFTIGGELEQPQSFDTRIGVTGGGIRTRIALGMGYIHDELD